MLYNIVLVFVKNYKKIELVTIGLSVVTNTSIFGLFIVI